MRHFPGEKDRPPERVLPASKPLSGLILKEIGSLLGAKREKAVAIVARLQHYLEENRVPYRASHHPEAFTSQEVAEVSHIPGKHLAKVVMVKIPGSLAMAVVPSTRHVNLDKLKALMHVPELELAREEEFAPRLPDCRPGTMPPFGNLYGLRVYVDEEIARQPELVFQAGTHEDVASLAYLHFARLVRPVVGAISD